MGMVYNIGYLWRRNVKSKTNEFNEIDLIIKIKPSIDRYYQDKTHQLIDTQGYQTFISSMMDGIYLER